MNSKLTIQMAIAGAFLSISGCSDSSSSTAKTEPTSTPEADTSYLDDLASQQGLETEPESAPVEQGVTEIVNSSQSGELTPADQENSDEYSEEDREWVAERESQSLFGRSRDKGIDIANQLQGGTASGLGLADTLSDEDYAASSGLRWEMPEAWRMAVPARGRFAEMYIANPLGNASVSFSKETSSARDLTRRMQGQIISSTGGRSRATTSTQTVQGYQVQIVELDGTYLDPGAKGGTNEQVFYAIHAAIFDMGDHRLLVKMWGPQDTVDQSVQLFDRMIENTTQQ